MFLLPILGVVGVGLVGYGGYQLVEIAHQLSRLIQ